jgi:hypothetical protein
MDWVTEPHPLDPVIAAAVERVASLLPVKRGVPIINARDCELAGFDLADVLAAAKLGAW